MRLTAEVAPVPPAELYPEITGEPVAAEPAGTAQVTLVPYFLWGNRRPEAMRVWVRAQ